MKRSTISVGIVFVAAVAWFLIALQFSQQEPREGRGGEIARSHEPKASKRAGEATSYVRSTASEQLMPMQNAATEVATRHKVVEQVLATPFRAPQKSQIPQLTFQDEAALIEAFRRIPSPTNRYGITVVLAFGGGDSSAEAFRHTIQDEFRGRRLHENEEESLFVTAKLLGVLAQRSNRAWDLVKAGCNPEFWARNELWLGVWTHEPHYLANYCIQGIGLVGTPEAAAFLNEIKDADFLFGEDTDLTSAVICAAANADLLRQHGRERFFDDIFRRREEFEYFRSWKRSPAAEPWLAWEASALKSAAARRREMAAEQEGKRSR